MPPLVDLHRIATHYSLLGEESTLNEIGEWLDSSKIKLLDLCPLRYYYRHELHLVPKQRGEHNFASPMAFGHAIHAALACYYMGEGFEEATCPCSDACAFCRGGKIPRMQAMFLINYPDDPIDDRDPRTRARGIEILAEYVSKWRREPFQVIGVEIPFAIPFGEFTYIGRIDLLVKENGNVKPIDHKTTSRFGEAFEGEFKLSHQMTGYMHSVHILLDIPVYEADINAARVTTRITDESFLRLTTSRTPEDFEAWEIKVRHAFDELKGYRASGYWPSRNPFACFAYNRQCEYYALCSAGKSTRQVLLETAYEKSPWLPITDD